MYTTLAEIFLIWPILGNEHQNEDGYSRKLNQIIPTEIATERENWYNTKISRVWRKISVFVQSRI